MEPQHKPHPADPFTELESWGRQTHRRVLREHQLAQVTEFGQALRRRWSDRLGAKGVLLVALAVFTAVTTSAIIATFSPEHR